MTAPSRVWRCPGCSHLMLRVEAIVNEHVAGCADARARFDANVLRDVFGVDLDAEAGAVFGTQGQD